MNLDQEISTMSIVVARNRVNVAFHRMHMAPNKGSYFKTLLSSESVAEVRKTLEDTNSGELRTLHSNDGFNSWDQLTKITEDWIRLYGGDRDSLNNLAANIIKRMKIICVGAKDVNVDKLADIWTDNPWTIMVMLLELVPYA